MDDNNSRRKNQIFRIVLSWNDVPSHVGSQAAVDIMKSFDHRPWHKDVICKWDEGNNSIILEASNDYDENGLALIDEFSDEISACVKNAGNGDIRVVSITKEEQEIKQ